jgi:hypothetical protein
MDGPKIFDEALKQLIGEQLSSVITDENISLIFDNESVWFLSLRKEDRRGLEALMYVDHSNKIWVL